MSLVECVPNFSEGRDRAVIEAIADAIRGVDGVTLLDVDPGAATHRTVFTFVGTPVAAAEAAFQAVARGSERIDMRRHRGEHPRLGAADVCPFVPVAGISLEECAELARQVGRRIGEELGIPVYLYEAAASRPERRSLAQIREGEYEGLAAKLTHPDWAPDFGPSAFNARSGATVVGARPFLIAYNVNLNTRDKRIANELAQAIREGGSVVKDDAGRTVRGADGKPQRVGGLFRECRAVGWFIEEFGRAQVSINLTNPHVTSMHAAFDALEDLARARGCRVTGSEIVGLVPRDAILAAGRHYLARQGKTTGVPESRLVEVAVQSLGLHDVKAFEPRERILEYRVGAEGRLASLSLRAFADETSTDSPAPGGGSVAALCGALAAALAAMVAALTHGRRGHEGTRAEMEEVASAAQGHKDAFLRAIDEDTDAFDQFLAATRLPKKTPGDRKVRDGALDAAAKAATGVPLAVLRRALQVLPLARVAATHGNPASISDAGVAAIAAGAAAEGAYLNVRINLPQIQDTAWRAAAEAEADRLVTAARAEAEAIRRAVLDQILETSRLAAGPP
jgi:glutamate formiminotransferase/formiminotetrahydrofolate cyclodeaminase